MKDNRKKDRTLFKDFLREIGGSLNRYLSILLIVMLGVAFYAGVRSAQPDMQLSADTLYDEKNMMDIRVLGTLGLTCWHSASTGAVSSVFTSNASLGVLAMTSAIFVFFKDLHFRLGECAQKRLIFASKCTFGVYLVHTFVLERLNLSYPLSAFALACCILGASLAVYGISFAVSAALNRVPKLNQWIV